MQRLLLFVDLVRQHEQAVAHIDVFAHDAFRDVRQIDGGEIPEFIHAEPHKVFGAYSFCTQIAAMSTGCVFMYSASLLTFRTSTPAGTF